MGRNTTARVGREPGQLWSLGWVVMVRALLYVVIVGFFLQSVHFSGGANLFRPRMVVVSIVAIFFANLAILALGIKGRWGNPTIALTYVIDLAVVTYVVLFSGGFNSIFISYYIAVLVMAPAWLPRRFTAVFPSMATLCMSYIGLAHLVVALDFPELVRLYPAGILSTMRHMFPHTIVTTMLMLAVLFFVTAYLSGIVSDRLFIAQRLNAEVLASMNEGVAVINTAGRLVYVNSEFRRIFPEARQGGPIKAILDDVLPEMGPYRTGVAKLLGDNPTQMLTLVQEATGSRPAIEMRLSGVMLRARKELFGVLFLVTDLSLRQRMEQAERGLERFASISTMAAGLAHEIRNPLASLRSAIQEIGASFPAESENRILADVVLAESDRLDGVIGRFLDFSREGRLRLGKRNLAGILRDVETMVRRSKGGEDVDVVLDIADDPEVVCDSDRIMEVFFNLALNAAQFVPHPGGRLDVRLARCDKFGRPGVEVLFMDNGPGISPSDLTRLFEPFFSRRTGGTGMGLALSKKQIGLHGGEIDAENMRDGGARFRIWLPLEQRGGTRANSMSGVFGPRIVRH